jgi:hypothetical protein
VPTITRRQKKQTESTVVDAIRADLGRVSSCTIFRNTVGTYNDVRFGWVTAGLSEESPDLVGWTRVPVANLVARGITHVAIFIGIEVKKPNGDGKNPEREAGQKQWLTRLQADGGLAGWAHNPGEAIEVVTRWDR